MKEKIDLFRNFYNKNDIIIRVKQAIFLLLWTSLFLIGCSPGQQGPRMLFRVKNATLHEFAVSFSQDNETYAYISNEGQVQIQSFLNRRALQTLSYASDNPPVTLTFSHDNTFLSVSTKASVDVWDIEKEQIVTSFLVDDLITSVGTLAFSPDDSLLALNAGHTLRIWNLQSEEIVLNIRVGHPFSYTGSIKFSPGGNLVAFNMRSLKVWNFENEELTNLGDGSNSFTFTADNSELVSARKGDIFRWQMPDGQFLGKFTTTGEEPIVSTVLPPGGEEVIIYTYDRQYFLDNIGEEQNLKFFVELWNVKDGELLWQTPLNNVDIYDFDILEVSPTGDRLALIGAGDSFAIWEIK